MLVPFPASTLTGVPRRKNYTAKKLDLAMKTCSFRNGICHQSKISHFGPDGVVSCTHHGRGVIKVKCPYSHKDETIMNAVIKHSMFCLMEKDGKLQLHRVRPHVLLSSISTNTYIFVKLATVILLFARLVQVLTSSLKEYSKITVCGTIALQPQLRFSSCVLPELLGHLVHMSRM